MKPTNTSSSIALIGGLSPLGEATARMLLAAGDADILITHRPDSSGVPLDDARVSHIAIDGLDVHAMADSVKDCDTVVWFIHDRSAAQGVNTTAFRDFVHGIEGSAVRKIVFISSGGAVYGEPLLLPVEETQIRNPLDDYGMEKKGMEDVLFDLEDASSIQTAIIRPANIYGDESLTGRSKGVVSSCLQCLMNGDVLSVFHNGETVRDYVHVDDVAAATIEAIRTELPHVVWNVGSELGYSTTEVINALESFYGGSGLRTKYIPVSGEFIRNSVLSTESLRSQSSWRMTKEPMDGFRELAQKARKLAGI
ncbi:MAG: hypothetical protein CL942_12570 [Desulfovibrio sp.]|nr:hypothetical protein [Desulfovibrio sp.]|tara:strand:- start:502 stop:1428 length:927 start_codon:yes stop_codon:yes gene_type:complete